MKTATVLFGEQLPKGTTTAACDLMLGCDALLIVGTSLNVFPAAKYPGLVRGLISPASLTNSGLPSMMTSARNGPPANVRAGPPAPIVEVNAMASTSPALPDVMITGRAGEWLPKLAARLIAQSGARPPSTPTQGAVASSAVRRDDEGGGVDASSVTVKAVAHAADEASAEESTRRAAVVERKRRVLARMAGVDEASLVAKLATLS